MNGTNILRTFAIAMKLNKGTEIIKVCSKDIKYFKEFGTRYADKFKQHIDALQPYLLPTKKIIYGGDFFFAYTQKMHIM